MNRVPLQLEKASALYGAGKYEDALDALLPDMDEQRSPVNALHLVAATFIKTRDFKEAARWVSAAISRDPHNAEFHNTKGAALLELGDVDAAAASFARAVDINPKYPEALRNNGLTLLRLGALEKAESALLAAIDVSPLDPSNWRFLAETRLAAQKHLRTSEAAKRLVELSPEDPRGYTLLIESLIRSGCGSKVQPLLDQTALQFSDSRRVLDFVAQSFVRIGQPARAIEVIESSLAYDGRSGPNIELTIALLHVGNWERFSKSLEELKTLEIKAAAPWLRLAEELITFDFIDEAEETYTRVSNEFPNSQPALAGKATVQLARGEVDDALRCVQSLDATNADYLPAILVAAKTFIASQNSDRAILYLRRYLASFPESVEVCKLLAEQLLTVSTATGAAPAVDSTRQLRLEEAHIVVRRAMSQVDDPKLFRIEGQILHQLQKHERAVQSLRESIAMQPGDAEAHHALGLCLQEQGDIQQAASHFRQALAFDPPHVSSAYQLVNSGYIEAPDQLMVTLERQLKEGEPSRQDQVLSYLTIGRLHDSQRDYDRAFAAYESGNRLKSEPWSRVQGDHSGGSHQELVRDTKRVFSKDFFDRRQNWGNDSSRPMFVVGLPRSGTTLTEQILASHSEIYGAGELQDISNVAASLARINHLQSSAYPNVVAELTQEKVKRLAKRHDRELTAMSPRARYVVDKMPTNFMYLGLISLLFPNAKIIHCRRQPLDVAVSCLRHNLQWPFCDQYQLGTYINCYNELMEHWHAVLPNRILNLDYETLVENPSEQIAQLLSFCDVAWEGACQDFQLSARPVATPSKVQVRQAIYTTSVGTWRRYAKHLPTLLSVLQCTENVEFLSE